jgi:leucyl-tRNA synthetase (EC 6.1.1.4)
VADPKALVKETVSFVLQVNGKLRTTVTLSPGSSQDEVEREARKDEKVLRALEGQTVIKRIFVPGKLLNLVVRPSS